MRTVLIRFHPVKTIAHDEIRAMWHKMYPTRRIPRIRGFILSDGEFDKAINLLLSSGAVVDTSETEYGHQVSVSDHSAYVFYADMNKTHIVLIRATSGFTVEEDLEHELEHVRQGISRPIYLVKGRRVDLLETAKGLPRESQKELKMKLEERAKRSQIRVEVI
jgi:hypothetical protein